MTLLLEKGADLEAKDEEGRSPLSKTVWFGREVVVKLLLEKGASLESKCKAGRTPLGWAVENGQRGTIKLLLEKGAEKSLRTMTMVRSNY